MASLVFTDRIGLNNNKLSSLPTELLNLKALRYINLRSNSLREFPSVVRQPASLELDYQNTHPGGAGCV